MGVAPTPPSNLSTILQHFMGTQLLFSFLNQVELNRAILKNVGKRVLLRGAGSPKVSRRYRQQWPVEREPERDGAGPEELQLDRQQLLPWKHFPSQLWSYGWAQSPSYSPSSQFADVLQSASTRPQSQEQAQALPGQKAAVLSYAKKSLDVAGMGLTSHRVNGNEANETNHEQGNGNGNGIGYGNGNGYGIETENDDGNGASKNPARYVDDDEENYNDVGPEGVGLGVGVGLGLGLERFEVFEDKPNWGNEELVTPGGGGVRGVANANDRMPWSYPYRFHKSQHNVN